MKKMHKTRALESDYKKSESWQTWEKEPSEFLWKYHSDETCIILEGSATIKDIEGKHMEIRAGEIVFFSKGLECMWKVHSAIKKKFLLH